MITCVRTPLITIVDMEFSDWLLAQIEERKWSQSDLARTAKLTRGAVSNYINGRIPDEKSLNKIARAFKLPPELIFQKAGLLPPSSADDLSDAKRQLIELAKQADEDTIDMAIAMLEAAHRQQRRKLKT